MSPHKDFEAMFIELSSIAKSVTKAKYYQRYIRIGSLLCTTTESGSPPLATVRNEAVGGSGPIALYPPTLSPPQA